MFRQTWANAWGPSAQASGRCGQNWRGSALDAAAATPWVPLGRTWGAAGREPEFGNNANTTASQNVIRNKKLMVFAVPSRPRARARQGRFFARDSFPDPRRPPDSLPFQMMQRPGTRASGGAASLPNADSQPNGSACLPGGWSRAGASRFITAVTLFSGDAGAGTERFPPMLPVGKSTTSNGAFTGRESRWTRTGSCLSPLKARFTVIAGSAISPGGIRRSNGKVPIAGAWSITRTAASAPATYVLRLDTAWTCSAFATSQKFLILRAACGNKRFVKLE